ncbi:MAG: helix-hairpin-helix domain-containing protein [Clostridia bacterium]|nr:helix-hairpin-helix domain-containing protein [Clostridia bacterium]
MKQKTFAVRSVLGWLLLAACVVLAAWAVLTGDEPPVRTSYAASGRYADVQAVPVQTGSILVNSADAALLDELPGVGEATAEAIIEERTLNGAFFYPEDLMHVKGIGDKKLEDMRDMLDLTEE